MSYRPNTQLLKGIRCPECFETQRFAVQITMNVVMEDDGIDFMGHQPPADFFPGRVIDEADGLLDADPIVCMSRSGCGRRGTVAEFRLDGGDQS